MTEVKKHSSLNSYLVNAAFILLGLAVILTSMTAAIPSWRAKVRSYVQSPFREVLAKARGDLTGQGFIVSVIKLKTQEGISVEVFQRVNESQEEKFLARLKLEERRDGHFTIRGQATNLALMDVDKDGLLEIMVPAYDENLIPRLHVFKFDPLGNTFVKMGPESVQF